MNLKDRIIDIFTKQSQETVSNTQLQIGRYQHYDDLVKSHEYNILMFHVDSYKLQKGNLGEQIKVLLPRLVVDKRELSKALKKRDEVEDLLLKSIEKNDFKYIKYLKKGLGKLRKEMPQIDAKNIKDVLEYFEDEDVKIKEKSIKISKILPSQRDFDDNKILSMVKKGSDKVNVTYLVSKDNYLVDGHHRWAAALEEDDNQEVNIHQINLPIEDLLKEINSLDFTSKDDEDEDDVVEKSHIDSALTILEAAYFEGMIEQIDIEKARNLAGLTPVRRQVRRQNGTVYTKTVYIKLEEKPTQKASNFVKQDDYEDRMRVGDSVNIHFTGYSTGAEYEGKAKIDEITETHIKVSLTEDLHTHNRNGYVYRVGDERSTFLVPRTSNKEWNQKLRISPIETEPARETSQERTQTFSPVKITDPNQVNNGDSVKFEHEGREVVAKVTSIWFQPNNKVRLTLKDDAGKQYYKQIGGRTELFKVGTDPEGMTSHQGEEYVTTEETFRQLRALGVKFSDSQKTALTQIWNGPYKNFNPVQMVTEMKEAIRNKLGPVVSGGLSISFSPYSSGKGFDFHLSKGRTIDMRRNFKSDGDMRTVYHAYFKLSERIQGGDLGKKLFKALHKQYINADVSSLSVSANINVGGYAWGQYGFRHREGEVGARYILSHFRAGRTKEIKVGGQVENYTITAQDERDAKNVVDRFYQRNLANKPFPMHLLCGIGGGKAGKAALLDKSWPGFLDLDDPEQRAHFENYINF